MTSVFPVYDLTRRIAGEDADVVMLEPVGVSPHGYAPPPGDDPRTTGMTLAIMVGLGLDAWTDPLMTRLPPKAHVLRLADRVPTLPLQSGWADGSHDTAPPAAAAIDPHVWLDPQRALLMGRAISDELCRADPAHAAGYRARSLELTHSLEALDREIEERTRGWKSKSFVTLHDDFGYYAARYHLEVAAAIETTPGAPPAASDIPRLLARVQERHAAAVFGEPQLDSKPAEALGRDAHLPYGVLDPLGGTAGVDSYEALLRADTLALEKGLSAVAP
jgi:zinc transport system substrate-binding protein